MKGNGQMILKLQTALNAEGDKILQRTKQFYSNDTKSPVTIYYVERGVWNEDKQKNINVELFHTTSQLQVILFMRDLLFINRGQALPTDNEIWNNKRKNIEFYQITEGIKYEGE